MHVNVFDFSQVLAASKQPYIEFLRVPAFSVGIYVLDAGATDPHLSGSASFQSAKKSVISRCSRVSSAL
jgi:hypothetical protein